MIPQPDYSSSLTHISVYG